MSSRTVRRSNTIRSRTRTRSSEITPNEIIEKLKKFEKEKNEFVIDFNLRANYEKIGNGKEMLNEFKESKLFITIDKFVNKYIKQEKKKLNKIEQKIREDIENKIRNVPNKPEKRELINKLIEEYEEIIGQIRTAMEPQEPSMFDFHTFEYYYHKSYKNISSSNELRKIKNDMADLQPLLDDEEDIEKKDELGRDLFDKYELLNKTFVDFAFVDLLAPGFEALLSAKEDMYDNLMDYIQKLLDELNPNGENMRVSGKKKTKKRLRRRKISKSKRRKKLI